MKPSQGAATAARSAIERANLDAAPVLGEIETIDHALVEANRRLRLSEEAAARSAAAHRRAAGRATGSCGRAGARAAHGDSRFPPGLGQVATLCEGPVEVSCEGRRGFVEDLDAEFLGLVQFRAGFFAGEDVVGFFADTTADFAAEGFDFGLGFFALVVAVFVLDSMINSFLTTDFSAWYGQSSLAIVILIGAMALWGFRLSLGSRPLVSASALENT